MARMFWLSKWFDEETYEKAKENGTLGINDDLKFFAKNDVKFWKSSTYVRPKVEGEIKGKLNIKYAKRQRVKALKETQNR